MAGKTRIHHQKGVYFDGHDRADVVEYRDMFLIQMDDLDKKSLTCYDDSLPQLTEGERPLIRVVHHGDQSFFWGDEQTNVLRQKSLGSSIMVSDFIDELSGFIRDDQGEARFLLETHQEGYFTNDLLLQQVVKTVDIFERVHPNATAIFLFDNAPSHRKVAEDALNADHMNAGPGGKQAIMRDTVWGGEVQRLVDDHSVPKGMKIVLQERGIDTTGMKCKDMRDLLKTFPDFKGQKTILENYIEGRGHICTFYPKFHCELSPIEREGTITRLRKIVPQGLDSVTLEQIKKNFRTCRDYERVYREVEGRVKMYKSHRRVYSQQS